MAEVDFKLLLEYSEQSLSGLVWISDMYTYKDRGLKLASAGDIAGYLHTLGYWVVTFSECKYQAHRIVWEILKGPIPEGLVIDHRNGDPSDNNILNLRVVTSRGNSQNRRKDSRNKSGKMGVFSRTHKGVDYWVASWVNEEGISKQKNYSVNKYGEEGARALAEAFRDNILDIRNEEGSDYTIRHGQ